MNVSLRDASTLTYTTKDLIVTDPPYNIGYKYNGTFKDRMTPDQYGALFEPMKGHRVVMIHYVEAIYEDVAPWLGFPEHIAAWTYPSNTAHKAWRAIAWFNCMPNWKKYRVPYANPTDKRVQKLMQKTGGRAVSNHWHVNVVKNVSREKVKEYTNQIPEELIRRIIATTAYKGDTIVDPFSGTGTTAAVAQKMGYSHRSYDVNPLAVKLTSRRIQQVISHEQGKIQFV